MVVRHAVRYINVRYVSVCIATILLYMCCSYLIAAITRVYTHEIIFDPLFSPQRCIELQHACAQIPTGSTLTDYVQQLHALHVQDASIAAWTIALHVPCTVRITFHAQQPAIMINDNYCVTNVGSTYRSSALHEQVLNSLPNVIVHDYRADDRELNASVVAWVDAMPRTLRDDYSLVWHNSTTRYVYPKKSSFSYVLVCAEVPLTLSLEAACTKAIEEQQKQSSCVYHWIADVRFAHQIIIKKERIQKVMGG